MSSPFSTIARMRSLARVAVLSLASLTFASSAAAQNPRATVTFENRSGHTALVKLIGPTEQTVTVPNGQSRTVGVSGGMYYIVTRYGGTPAEYTYTKGGSFTVTQTSYQASIITITLHRVVGGNYGSRPVSAAEFDVPRRP